MARPISAPYSSWMLRSDSGEPSNPDRFASTTSGRLPLAALIARAVFFDDCGNSVPGGPLVRAVGRAGTRAAGWPRLDADDRHRVPAEVRVHHHRGVGVGHARPSAPGPGGPGRRPRASPCGCRTASSGPCSSSAEKMSPTVVNVAGRVHVREASARRGPAGRSVSAPARDALPGRDVGVVVVGEQDLAGRREVRRPVLRLRRSGPSPGRSRRCRSCPRPTRRRSSPATACRSAPSRCPAS